MDPVEIPEDVLRQLRESSSSVPALDGGFTTAQLAEALGVGADTARKRIRKLFRAGRLTSRAVALTHEQANELGHLGGGRTIVYFPTGEAA